MSFGAFVRQNKPFNDVTPGFRQSVMAIGHYFLTFYRTNDQSIRKIIARLIDHMDKKTLA